MEVLDLTTSPPPDTSQPEPKRRFRLPSRPVVALLTFLSGALLIFISFSFFQSNLGPAGTIAVTSSSDGAEVKINDQKVGSTPYQGEHRPGEYKISVADPFGTSWEGKIRLEAGTLASIARDLGPSETYSGGVILTLARGNGIEVKTSPAGAEVSLDGTVVGNSPLTRPAPSPGTHKITISTQGFVTKEFEISVTNGWKLVVEAGLYKNPDPGVAPIEEISITPTSVSEPSITTRASSGLDRLHPKVATPSYTPWTRAAFYDLGSADQDLTKDILAWLKGLYFYTLTHLNLPDFPFHFVIDSQGTIYEARSGGRDITSLDVASGLTSASKTPTLKPGLAIVGYLGQKGGATPAAKESFRKLVAWLGSPVKASGEGKGETAINVKSGEEYSLALSFKNTGWATWDNFNSNRVLLTLPAASPFYNSSSWIDSTHPSTSDETFTPRGSEASFKVALKALAYGGDYDLVFSLTRGGAMVEGTSLTVKIHVDGPAKPTQQLKIKSTPTGFLRVRSGAGTSFAEVGRVNPGETFEWLTEVSGWVQIKLASGTLGWVSTTYITKI